MNYVMCSSDWHLHHANKDGLGGILEFERGKRFKNIKEHDDFIIGLLDGWLQNCDNKDGTFFFLGDFGKPTAEDFDRIKEVFDAHSCTKIAIFGNHDKDMEKDMMRQLFNVCSEYPIYIDKRVVLSHYPQPTYESTLNVHGHLHSGNLSGPNYLNASVHMASYHPITTERITSNLGKLPKYDTRFLYEPWADRYEFKTKKDDVICDKAGRIDLSASRLLHYLNAKERRDTGHEYSADNFLADEVHFYD